MAAHPLCQAERLLYFWSKLSGESFFHRTEGIESSSHGSNAEATNGWIPGFAERLDTMASAVAPDPICGSTCRDEPGTVPLTSVMGTRLQQAGENP